MEKQKNKMRKPVIRVNQDTAGETKPHLTLVSGDDRDGAARIEAVRQSERRLLPATVAVGVGFALLILYNKTVATGIAFQFGHRYPLIYLVLYIVLIGVLPLAVGLIGSDKVLKREDVLPRRLWTVAVTAILGFPLAVLAVALNVFLATIGKGLGLKAAFAGLTPYYAIIRNGALPERILLILIVVLGAVVFEVLLRQVMQNGIMSISRIPFSTLYMMLIALITACLPALIVPCLLLGLISGLLFRKDRAILGNILLHAIFILTFLATPFYDDYIAAMDTVTARFDVTRMLIGLLALCVVIPLYLLLDSTFQKSLLHARDWIIFVHEKKTYPRTRLFLIVLVAAIVLWAVAVIGQ